MTQQTTKISDTPGWIKEYAEKQSLALQRSMAGTLRDVLDEALTKVYAGYDLAYVPITFEVETMYGIRRPPTYIKPMSSDEHADRNWSDPYLGDVTKILNDAGLETETTANSDYARDIMFIGIKLTVTKQAFMNGDAEKGLKKLASVMALKARLGTEVQGNKSAIALRALADAIEAVENDNP